MSSTLIYDICAHVRAGSPAIFIQSGEEQRVDLILKKAANALGTKLVREWNLGHGWVRFDDKRPLDPDIATLKTDLEHQLLTLLDEDHLDHSLIVIKDAKAALDNNPLAAARLKQLLNRIERHHSGCCAVLLVAEAVCIPASLESQITLLTLPLPDRAYLSEVLDTLAHELQVKIPSALRPTVLSGLSGLSMREVRQVLRMVLHQGTPLSRAQIEAILNEKKQIIAKSGVLEMVAADVDLKDVGGLENLTAWLTARAKVIERLDEAVAHGVKAPKGVLIAGMPGCGKSLTAKVAAKLFGMPLLRLDIGSLLGKYVGESEGNMRRALSMAETVSPCIVWIDELEKAFAGMGGSGSEVSSRLLGYFLTWMQEKSGAVFVIATANDVTALPPELLRKGRFDEIFYVAFPSPKEREQIFKIHLNRAKQDLITLDLDALVANTRDFCGADIENAVNEAVTSCFLTTEALTQQALLDAIKGTRSLRETLQEKIGEYEALFEKLKLRPASKTDGVTLSQLISWSTSSNPVEREKVAQSPDVTSDLLERLCKDPDHHVQLAAFKNPHCPSDAIALRINQPLNDSSQEHQLLQVAYAHANASAELIGRQLQPGKLPKGIRLALANSVHALALAQQLVEDSEVAVRAALAAQHGLPEGVQLALSKQPHEPIRRALAENPTISTLVLAQLADALPNATKLNMLRSGRLGSEHLLPFAEDADEHVRAAVAAVAGLSEELQQQLASDNSPHVLCALILNTSVASQQMCVEMKENLDEQVRDFLSFCFYTDVATITAELTKRPALFSMRLEQEPDLPSKVKGVLSPEPNAQPGGNIFFSSLSGALNTVHKTTRCFGINTMALDEHTRQKLVFLGVIQHGAPAAELASG